jgi:prepilin-type N-terminal cleavage/methylation domain-containing protein
MKGWIGLGAVGLILVFSLISNEGSFAFHVEAHERALEQTAAWETRLSDVLTIRGKINGVVESVSQGSADSIEQAISNLQTTPADMTAIHGATKVRLNTGIQQLVLAARTQQVQNVLKTSADLSPLLTNLENQFAKSRQGSEIDRGRAFANMNSVKNTEVVVLGAFAAVFAAFLALGFRGLRDWLRRQPPAVAIATSRGFSLVELLMVVAIALTLSTIAVANIAAVVSSARIHAGISSMSGLLQNTRITAVKKNKTLTAHLTSEDGALVGYIKPAADTSPRTSKDTQVEWESPVVRMSTPTGTGAPDEITASDLGFTPQSTDISFNSRGLPCAYASGLCTSSGFLYYFKDTSREGNKGWAALSVSPAGKITKWFWSSGIWNR